MSARPAGWYADGLGHYEWFDGTVWTGDIVATPPSARQWRAELLRRDRERARRGDRVVDLANGVPESDEVRAAGRARAVDRNRPRRRIGVRTRHRG